MSKTLEAKILAFLRQPSASGFEPLAFEICDFQRRENRAFADYCGFLDVPLQLTSWKQIPAVPQQAFKHSELCSFPREQAIAQFRTSGTTGEGYGSHFLPSFDLYEAAVQQGWDAFQLPRHEFFFLMQHPADAPFSSLSHMGGILAQGQSDRFFIDRAGRLQVNQLRSVLASRSKPVALFGTALAFLKLFEQAAEKRYPLPTGSIVIETGGLKGSGREISKRDLYHQFSYFFGVDTDSIWNEYGMTELSSQFYSYGLNRSHHAPAWLRFMIINPNSGSEAARGEIGMLRVVDLANLWSVLAIQTQDLAIAQPDGGFLLLGRDPKALPRGCSRAMDELLQLGPAQPGNAVSDALARDHFSRSI